jgi:hypothetical protein
VEEGVNLEHESRLHPATNGAVFGYPVEGALARAEIAWETERSGFRMQPQPGERLKWLISSIPSAPPHCAACFVHKAAAFTRLFTSRSISPTLKVFLDGPE